LDSKIKRSSKTSFPLLADGGIGTGLLPELPPGLNCVDLLNVQAPERVTGLHRAYLAAGAGLLTSNTFCCEPESLAGSGWETRLADLTRLGASLARQAAPAEVQIAGSLGPGWKQPRRGEISIRQLQARTRLQAEGLVQGGADLCWIETVQDPRQAEAAVTGCLEAMQMLGRQLPIAVLVSVSATGHEIGGQALSTVLRDLLSLPVQILGVNCSFGPQSVHQALHWLREHSSCALACCPNLGLPGQSVSQAGFVAEMMEIQARFQPEILGGCCGVGPAEISALYQALAQLES